MQEAGVPVTYGYISDIHERKDWSTNCTTATATGVGNALGPGDACYVDERPALRPGVQEVPRPARQGRHHAEEHAVRHRRRGERPLRRRERRAAPTTRTTRRTATASPSRAATRPVRSARSRPACRGCCRRSGATPRRSSWSRRAPTIYVTNRPARRCHHPRTTRRCGSSSATPPRSTANNPHSGVQGEKIVNYQAGATEQRILHLHDGGPAAEPDVHALPEAGLLPRPVRHQLRDVDEPGGGLREGDARLRLEPRLLQPGHRHHVVVVRGPRRQAARRRRPEAGGQPAGEGPERRRPRAAVQQARHLGGRDRRPADDAPPDGARGRLRDGRPGHHADPRGAGDLRRIAATWAAATSSSTPASGEFGTDTLLASTRALASGSAGDDSVYARTDAALSALGNARDALAQKIKVDLDRAEFRGARLGRRTIGAELVACNVLLNTAASLAR